MTTTSARKNSQATERILLFDCPNTRVAVSVRYPVRESATRNQNIAIQLSDGLASSRDGLTEIKTGGAVDLWLAGLLQSRGGRYSLTRIVDGLSERRC